LLYPWGEREPQGGLEFVVVTNLLRLSAGCHGNACLLADPPSSCGYVQGHQVPTRALRDPPGSETNTS
jgi:hypothetical protein